ncbi:hypothetical protein BSPWISOXPB_1455 [uncultured Gammaproteobacteria bacterium]|nr:hypothetical protein BSPWISOXPB_1455 [uncultured Gammaproteobacteria bacterium]
MELPDPFWLISFSSVVLLIPVNNVALEVNKNLDSEFKNNENFTGWNWVGLVMGGLLVLPSIMSMFLLEV